MLSGPIGSKELCSGIRLSQQGEVCTSGSSLPFSKAIQSKLSQKQSLKELGISFVRALLGPFRTTIGFPSIYQVTKCVLSNQREVFKAVVLSYHCSLLKGPLIV